MTGRIADFRESGRSLTDRFSVSFFGIVFYHLRYFSLQSIIPHV